MVLLILKEQQPNQISQDQAKSLQQMHLVLEKEAPFQIRLLCAECTFTFLV